MDFFFLTAFTSSADTLSIDLDTSAKSEYLAAFSGDKLIDSIKPSGYSNDIANAAFKLFLKLLRIKLSLILIFIN